MSAEERADILNLDRKTHFPIFELCTAIELGLSPWSELAPEVFENAAPAIKEFAARGKKPRDYGIDCASLDLRRVAQAKWYKPGSNISWHDISTFFALSTVVRATDTIIATSEGVKLAKLAAGLPIRHIVITNVRIIEICTSAGESSLSSMWRIASQLMPIVARRVPESAICRGPSSTQPVNLLDSFERVYPTLNDEQGDIVLITRTADITPINYPPSHVVIFNVPRASKVIPLIAVPTGIVILVLLICAFV